MSESEHDRDLVFVVRDSGHLRDRSRYRRSLS